MYRINKFPSGEYNLSIYVSGALVCGILFDTFTEITDTDMPCISLNHQGDFVVNLFADLDGFRTVLAEAQEDAA